MARFQTARKEFRFEIIRVLAKIVDLLAASLLKAIVPGWLGVAAGVLYLIFADALFLRGDSRPRSLGKRLLGLCVEFEGVRKLSQNDKRLILSNRLKTSALRNLSLGFFVFFASIALWGWVLAIIIGLPLCVVDLYSLFQSTDGRRWGDVMASTYVKRV